MAAELSSSMEDYLEAICRLGEGGRDVRVKQIADVLDVSLPSVTSALKTLSDADLITHQRYGSVELTEDGRSRAESIYNRHRTLVRFLTEILLIDGDAADTEACAMEHSVSPSTLQRLTGFMGAIQRCPRHDAGWLDRLHGRWRGASCDEPCEACILVIEGLLPRGEDCPGSNGNGDEPVFLVPLSRCAPGVECVIRRVRGRGPIRRRLADMGIGKGATVEVQRVAPLGDPLDVKIRGYHLCLRKREAASILVEPVER